MHHKNRSVSQHNKRIKTITNFIGSNPNSPCNPKVYHWCSLSYNNTSISTTRTMLNTQMTLRIACNMCACIFVLKTACFYVQSNWHFSKLGLWRTGTCLSAICVLVFLGHERLFQWSCNCSKQEKNVRVIFTVIRETWSTELFPDLEFKHLDKNIRGKR